MTQELLSDPHIRREYEEERLYGEAVANISGLLESLKISRRRFAERLGVSAGRISQMLSGERNLTLRSLAAMAWALGYEVDIRVKPMSDRSGTPAHGDPPPPEWVHRLLEDSWEPSGAIQSDFFSPDPVWLQPDRTKGHDPHRLSLQLVDTKGDDGGIAA